MKRFTLVLLAMVVASSSAFTAPVTKGSRIMENSISTTTELAERRWNFNDQFQGPFGLKKNAEIWNGRVAQVSIDTSLQPKFEFPQLISINFSLYQRWHLLQFSYRSWSKERV